MTTSSPAPTSGDTLVLDREAVVDDLRPRRPSLSASARLVVAVVLAGALVLAVLWGVVLTVDRASTSSAATSAAGDTVASQEQDRRAAQLAVSSFVANLNNYSVRDIDGYKQRLTALLTPGFAESFALAVDGIVTNVKATKMTSTGDVLQTAISAIDAHGATALVVADAHVTSAFGERVRHFRFKVSVVQRGGSWLVDDFQPVE